VGEIFLDLAYTKNRDTKFHCTMDLYWHAKTMVAQGVLPKEKDYMKFRQRLKALES
jgi:hypothetical protein